VKIDGNIKTTGTGSTASRPRVDRSSKEEGSASGAVTLSAASTQLAGAGSGAPVDGARIAAIKQAIAEGRFQINPEAIADSLIDTARDLLQSQRKA
jgi:negative regulator of flagellin synthesis FlgM